MLFPETHLWTADPDATRPSEQHRKVLDIRYLGDSRSETEEDLRHGTHVAGLVLGSAPSEDLLEDATGVAPNAKVKRQHDRVSSFVESLGPLIPQFALPLLSSYRPYLLVEAARGRPSLLFSYFYLHPTTSPLFTDIGTPCPRPIGSLLPSVLQLLFTDVGCTCLLFSSSHTHPFPPSAPLHRHRHPRHFALHGAVHPRVRCPVLLLLGLLQGSEGPQRLVGKQSRRVRSAVQGSGPVLVVSVAVVLPETSSTICSPWRQSGGESPWYDLT